MQLDLIISGQRACFRRPEMRVDLVSYDVITPPVATSMFDNFHAEPGCDWNLERIMVMRPIVRHWHHLQGIDGKLHRILALEDVTYRISARLLNRHDRSPVSNDRLKSQLLASRVCKKIHLGLKELAGTLRVANEDVEAVDAPTGDLDLGWMIMRYKKARDSEALYFRAIMRDGVIDLADRDSLVTAS